jgi:hypothetical protein
VEIIPPLLMEYLHSLCSEFEFNFHLGEMVEVVEVFFYDVIIHTIIFLDLGVSLTKGLSSNSRGIPLKN